MATGEEFTAADYDALPEVLTPQQVALMINASTVQVRRWAAEGVIPGRRFGNRWRFSKSLLEQMIREGTPADELPGAGSIDPEADEPDD
ncbi:helix-turn-helix domain-containing protein [Solicola sp. PLA-1-18]|uniref:helix-turn-helix domain-containing protein n=1 Tax=Solicola sp. PLA-1-18 TaxID=3380532 RepID=UPI003B809197